MITTIVRVVFFLFVVQIFDGTHWNDASSHTIRTDAETQVTIFEGRGISTTNIRIVEKNDFTPPQNADQ